MGPFDHLTLCADIYCNLYLSYSDRAAASTVDGVAYTELDGFEIRRIEGREYIASP